MTAPRIRVAQSADLPALVAMLADDDLGRRREQTSGPLEAAYIAAMTAITADPCHAIWIAEQRGLVVGQLQLSYLPGLARRGAWRAQIEAVRVANDVRGQGIGAALMTHAIDQARAAGCILVQLTTDRRRADAHGFYARLGFEPSHVGMKLTL